MKKFYLIHGFEGWPNHGFLPWLMGEIFRKTNNFAVSLEMPNPENPICSDWVEKIQSEIVEPNINKYLIGHSLGVPAILRYLESIKEGENIGGVFLVAGFFERLDIVNNDQNLSKLNNFLEKEFNFEHIKKVCNIFYIIHGEEDHLVPKSFAEKLGEKLNVRPLFIKNAGHFSSSQVFELPELLELIKREI